jgi:glycine cleavage system protein P-like pyridoxal-binding family
MAQHACEQMECLMATYTECLQLYNENVQDMERVARSADSMAYADFQEKVNASRAACEKAKLDLKRHTDEHGCLD